MNLLLEGLWEALYLIRTFDKQVLDAALRSCWITSLAILLAASIGIPVGYFIGSGKGMWFRLVEQLFRSAIALPTVFVGLICYMLLSRQGVAGPLDLLYTPWAIVMGEVILALPIIVSMSAVAIRSLDERIVETAATLGASRWRQAQTMVYESRAGVVLAIVTAFGRCVTELGIAMMVGGNIKSQTRTLATATALETGQGEFARALAMGVILLIMALAVTLIIGWLSSLSSKGAATR